MNNHHHNCIPEAIYYLSVYNMHFKFRFIYWVKKYFSLIQFCHCTLKCKYTIMLFINGIHVVRDVRESYKLD